MLFTALVLSISALSLLAHTPPYLPASYTSLLAYTTPTTGAQHQIWASKPPLCSAQATTTLSSNSSRPFHHQALSLTSMLPFKRYTKLPSGERVEVTHAPETQSTPVQLGYTSEAFPDGPYYCALCQKGHKTPQGLRGHKTSALHLRNVRTGFARTPGFSRTSSQSSIDSVDSSEADNIPKYKIILCKFQHDQF